MKTIIEYLNSFLTYGIPFLLLSIPIYGFCRMLFLSTQRKSRLNQEMNYAQELGLVLLTAFLTLLFVQTWVIVNPTNASSDEIEESLNQIELIPFNVIIEQFTKMHDSAVDYRTFILNIIGNIGIFVPIGVMIPLLFRTKFPRTTLAGFYISLIIETGQLPLDRTTDVDDLILNTTGAMIGYGIYALAKRILSKNRK